MSETRLKKQINELRSSLFEKKKGLRLIEPKMKYITTINVINLMNRMK